MYSSMGKDFRDPKLKGKENHKRKSNAHTPVQYLWITSAISICFSEIQKTLTPKITKVGLFSFSLCPVIQSIQELLKIRLNTSD